MFRSLLSSLAHLLPSHRLNLAPVRTVDCNSSPEKCRPPPNLEGSPNAIEGGMKEVDHQNSSSVDLHENAVQALLKNVTIELSDVNWEPPKFNSSLLEEVAAHAKNLSETVQSFIYVMLFNHAYRRHVANWLCNTAEFQGVHERTLFISISNETCEYIREEWGEKIYCIFLPLDGYDASLDFASRTFNNLMLVRAHLILSLAKSSIEMVLIESDAIWFRDPYPLFARHFTFNTADTVTPLKGGQEQAELREMSPLVIRPTDRFVRFWKGLTKKLENLTDVDDQTLYNRLCLMRFKEHECGTFYYEDVADGAW
ncbi:hypothetical protein Y032_0166g65 [Ancylostoma ceylanicum]|uniref:Nucleotide-diphospho-sugar transferase domain-containing protein n=1 Tax=Ancylostoma ceylanicum TaxID=53326 RepID=A0A016SWK7_9BILA|nr:hypothetical protein Y032_0166g65 [Ancylostoma ceylanicum]